MVYLNPGGINFGPKNWDGYGISNIAFVVVYSVFLFAACVYLWYQRHHPVVRMRKVGLMLLSVLVIHGFCFLVFTIYTMNGAWPCTVEFWSMNLYLPIGIGLWQAQNQQLLIVSRQQSHLIHFNHTYRPLLPPRGHSMGTPRYWFWRLKIWYRNISSQGKYEGFVLIGIMIQFTVSFVIYNISRKFNRYGIVSHHTSPALCRRGWEWAPSVAWQFLWHYLFGPYLLWKIRMVRDIYHWRLQTIIAVVAGLPGTPLWLAAVYTDKFGPVNKYWFPAMWFIPGMMAMQIVTLAFPIYQITKHKRDARAINRALTDFDQKKDFDSSDNSITLRNSLSTVSLKSKRNGKMYSMDSLDECLAGSHGSLQVYASCMELNGENIIFLTKVLAFKQACEKAFKTTCSSTIDFRCARNDMFRQGLSIFVTLVHSRTASYPINIESPIYNSLEAIFGPATAIVAMCITPSRSTSFSAQSSNVTPWDEPQQSTSQALTPLASQTEEIPSFPMRVLAKDRPRYAKKGNGSSERMVGGSEEDGDSSNGLNGQVHDPLEGVKVPAEFDERVFDAAFKSIRYMVWSETWQRYMVWKRKSGEDSIGRAI
ncbi:MAG: hypothetical protein Q9184_007810 [Pyrenodesmia sp. 2 TL-2023]